MKNPELYHKTVDILVQAYFNDTLQHLDCAACAVGNLCMANMGYTDIKQWESYFWSTGKDWGDVFMGGEINDIGLYNGEAKRQIDSTGYTISELMNIEVAFEYADEGNNKDEYMFNGLMAVIEVLDIIHDNTDAEVTTTSKSRFNKQLA